MPRLPSPLPASLPAAFTRVEGLGAGVPRGRLEGALVFCRPAASELECVRAWARTLPAGWVPSHHTAALLLGLPLPARAPARPAFIEVPLHASGHRWRRPQRNDASYHETPLTPEDVVEVDGVLVTRPARTFRDLAAHLSLLDLVALGDKALALEPGIAVLESQCKSMRKGKTRATQAIPLLNKLAETPQESWLRVLIIAAGLPNPAPQVELVDAGGRSDLYIEKFKTAVEHLGVDHFDPRKVRADYDPDRRRRYHRAGHEYVEVTSSLRTVNDALVAVFRVADAVTDRGWCGRVDMPAVVQLVHEARQMPPPWRLPPESSAGRDAELLRPVECRRPG